MSYMTDYYPERYLYIIRADSSVSLAHWRFAVQFPDPILDRIPPTVNDISFSFIQRKRRCGGKPERKRGEN